MGADWAEGSHGAAPLLNFGILGSLEVRLGEDRLAVGRPTLRALLIRLLLDANTVVSVDELVDDLWPESRPSDPVSALHNHLYRLRHALDRENGASTAICRHPTGYAIELSRRQLDAWRFEDQLVQAEQARNSEHLDSAAQHLQSALALWRGPVLSDVAGAGFAQPEIKRLSEMKLVAEGDFIDVRLALGQHHQVVSELQALTAEMPLRERPWGQLILALYRCGRSTDALRTYQSYRVVLATRSGLLPGPALQRLEAQILAQDPALTWVPAAGPQAVEANGHAPAGPGPARRFPVQLTSFVGREGVLAQVTAQLAQSRLVTLAGSAGCGKSRIAVKIGVQHDGLRRDGAWFVDLAPVTDPSAVPAALAATLGIRQHPGTSLTAALVNVLSQRDTLLVLDNCEHLSGAVRELVESLLLDCPEVQVLATSREWLGTPLETVVPVPPHAVPPPELPDGDDPMNYEAVQLFVERTRSHDPSLILDGQARVLAAEICRRVDGIALALELAAGLVGGLDLAEIAERLDEGLAVLDGSRPSGNGRHPTLRRAFDASYNLLPERERVVFRRLGVFAGSFALPAAEMVCGGGVEVADTVYRLVSRSLVAKEWVEGRARYRLLETLREYANEWLAEHGELAVIRRRHFDWYLDLTEAAEPHLTGRDQTEWLDRLQVEHSNLRAALEFAYADSCMAEVGVRMAGALSMYWFVRGFYAEGRGWLDRMLEGRQTAPPLPVAKALWGSGMLAALSGDGDQAERALRESVRLGREWGDELRVGRALDVLAMVASFRNEMSQGQALLEECIPIAERAGDAWCLADALGELGWIEGAGGDYQSSDRHCSEALRVATEHGDKQGARMALIGLALTAFRRGELERSKEFAQRGLEVARELGDVWFTAYFSSVLADTLAASGAPDLAADPAQEALRLAREAGAPMIEVSARHALARSWYLAGATERAEEEAQRALGVARAAAVPNSVVSPVLRSLAEFRLLRGDTEGAVAFLDEAMSLAGSVGDRYTLAQCRSFRAFALGGDNSPAPQDLAGALADQRCLPDNIGLTQSLTFASVLAAGKGRFEAAARLLGCAEGLSVSIRFAPTPLLQRTADAVAAAGAQAMGRASWESALATGRAESIDRTVELAAQWCGPGPNA